MHCCCTDGDPVASAVPARSATSPPTPPSNARRTSWPRRVAELVQWALPLIALALIPKCPVCVAGYVLFFTGIGLSRPTATTLRWTFIALGIGALAYLLLRAARRVIVAA